jgi:hypothetical protein
VRDNDGLLKDPGFVIPDLIRDRGDELLKEPGFVRFYSVIPGLT